MNEPTLENISILLLVMIVSILWGYYIAKGIYGVIILLKEYTRRKWRKEKPKSNKKKEALGK